MLPLTSLRTIVLNDGFVTKYGPCALLTVRLRLPPLRPNNLSFIPLSRSLSLSDQGKGVPDLAARRFVRMLKDTLPSLVVLALCDYDPWGLQILCTYAFGSQVRQ